MNINVGSLDYYKKVFNSIGWFIPPYTPMKFLGILAQAIDANGVLFEQNKIEELLAFTYSAENLAAMVCERYPITPFIQEYSEIISESVEAHFAGLDHVAVAGLMPVIEGAGRKIADSRSVHTRSIKKLFLNLAEDCKKESIEKKIGDVAAIISMMDSFSVFAQKHLYIESSDYSLHDKTNRHGILHGVYSDKDYGNPINFYKSIAAVDFLCFVSAFRASISWLAPSPTEFSYKLALHYHLCQLMSRKRPRSSNGSNS